MANRYLNQFTLNPRKGSVEIHGTINLSSAAAVVSSDLTSLISSVVKSATGTYTITLADKWVGCNSIQATYQGATAATKITITSVDVVSAKTIVLKTEVSGSVADVAAVCVINLSIHLKNSTAR